MLFTRAWLPLDPSALTEPLEEGGVVIKVFDANGAETNGDKAPFSVAFPDGSADVGPVVALNRVGW